MVSFLVDYVELVGSRFCPFRRAVEMLLHEHTVEFKVINDDNRFEYPILKYQGGTLYGIIAIVEEMHFGDMDLSKHRMWLAIILGELWYNSASFILRHRILALRENRNYNLEGMKQIRNKLAEFLKEIDIWFKEHHYFDVSFGYTDSVCASIIMYLDDLNEIDWSNKKFILDWYKKIQCRPSFKSVFKTELNNGSMLK